MAITVRGSGVNALASTTTSGANVSITPPLLSIGGVVGDVAFAHIQYRNQAVDDLALPSGWTLVGTNVGTALTQAVAYYYLTGSDSDPTFSATLGANGYLDAAITVFTGVRAGNPVATVVNKASLSYTSSRIAFGSTAVSNPEAGTGLAFVALDRTTSTAETYTDSGGKANYSVEATGSQWSAAGGQNGFHTGYIRTRDINASGSLGETYYSTTTSVAGLAQAIYVALLPDFGVGMPKLRAKGSVASTTVAFSSSGTLTVPLPAYRAGDYAILCIAYGCQNAYSSSSYTAPSGYNLLATHSLSSGAGVTLWYGRVLTATETNPTAKYTSSFSQVSLAGQVSIYGGVSAAGVEAVTTKTGTWTATHAAVANNPVSFTPSSVTASRANSTYVCLYTHDTSGNFGSSAAHTIPPAYSNEFVSSLTVPVGFNTGIAGAYDTWLTSAGAYQPQEIQSGGYATDPIAATSLILMGPAAGETVTSTDDVITLGATEARDDYNGSLLSLPAITLGATEGADSFSGQMAGDPIVTLGGIEDADTYTGNFYNFAPAATPTYIGRASAITASTSAAATRTAAPGAISGATTSDYVYCFVSVLGNTTNVPTAPSGFTQLGTSVTVGSGTTRQIITRVYGGLYNGSNVGTWSVTLPAGANTYAISVSAVVYRGVDPANPLEGFVTGTSTSTSPVGGLTITSSGQNRLLIQDIVRFGNYTGTQPSGWTERVDINSTTPTSGGAYSEKLNERAQATAGSVAHGNETYSTATAQNATLVGFAIFGPSPADLVIQTTGTEAPDSYSGSMSSAGMPTISGSMASTEGSDAASLTGSVYTPAVLAATEAADAVSISGSIANATATGVTWNPNDKAASMVLSNGNLSANCGPSFQLGVRATQSFPAGSKIYYEWNEGSLNSLDGCAGIYRSDYDLEALKGYSYYLYSDSANFFEAMNLPDGSYPNINQQGYPNGISTPYIVGVAYDEVNRRIYFSVNGIWLFGGNPSAGTGGYLVEPGTYFPGCTPFSGGTVTANFSRNTSYAVPTGYRTFADEAVSGDSGTLAATDSPDTATFTGQTSTSGTLGSTESVDTAGFTGTVRTIGSLAASEAYDTAAFAGSTSTAGALSASEAADAATLSGTLSTAGALTSLEAPDTAVFSGGTSTSGTLAATEATDTASINAGSSGSGLLAATEASDTATFTGSTSTSGSLAATEAPDTAIFGASQTTSGSLTASEPQDSAALTGSLSTSGTLVASETTDAANIGGSVASTGALAAMEAQDTASAVGSVGNTGILSGQEQPDTAAFSGSTGTSGALSAPENGDTAAFSGNLATSGTLEATEAPDTCYISTNQATSGLLVATEATDSASFSGGLSTSGSLTSTEAMDAASVQARIITSGSLASTEGEDTAAFTAAAFIPAVLLASENQDTASVSATAATNGALTASESTDQCYATGNVASIGDLQASEPTDTASLVGNSGTSGALASTESQDTVTFDISGAAQGSLIATETGDSAEITGAVISQGNLASTEPSDAATLDATVVTNGSLTAQETGDTATVEAQAVTAGALSASENGDYASLSGGTSTAGQLIVSETPDTTAFDADTYILAFLAASEGTDSAAVALTVSDLGDLSVTESADTASISADVSAIGALVASEAQDTTGFDATLSTIGALESSEAADACEFDAVAFIGGALAANENADTANFYSDFFIVGTLVATEAPDSAAIVATIPVPYADVRLRGQAMPQIKLSGRANTQIGLRGKIITTITTKGRLR